MKNPQCNCHTLVFGYLDESIDSELQAFVKVWRGNQIVGGLVVKNLLRGGKIFFSLHMVLFVVTEAPGLRGSGAFLCSTLYPGVDVSLAPDFYRWAQSSWLGESIL